MIRLLVATDRNDIERAVEGTENEDRVSLPDMKMSYVPRDAHPSFRRAPQRRKRDIDGVLYHTEQT